MKVAILRARRTNSARLLRRWLAMIGLLIASFVSPPLAAAAELNIYSHRQQFLLQPFLDAFTAETGIRTKVVYASKGLAQRLLAEGEASPADVILTVDIARLSEYADLDLLAAVDSPVLKANIPASLRAGDDRWFAFSTRPALSRRPRSGWLRMPLPISRILPTPNGRAGCAAARAAMFITGR